MEKMKKMVVVLMSLFTLVSFTPTVVNAQSGGGNPNPSQVQDIIDDIYEDVTPAQREMIEEVQRENYSCLVSGLIDAGFTFVGGGGGTGSLAAFLSNITTCGL
jgi:hypothetical protein